MINATLKQNTNFHCPSNAKEVIMISNGRGITPFLGMINKNNLKNIKTQLFWGGHTTASFKIYSRLVDKAFYNNNLSGLHIAFSQGENQKKYVQNLIIEKTDLVCRVLKNDGVVMICGSVAMLNAVLKNLEVITTTKLGVPLSTFKDNEQIKTDCY